MLKSSGPMMDPWGTPFMFFLEKYFYNVPALPFAACLRINFAAGNVLSQKGHKLPVYQ